MPKLIRITTSPIAFRYLLRGQMHYMKQKGMDVVMISSEGPDVEEVVLNEGCRFIPVQMNRAITPFQDIRAIRKLMRIFRNERPQIVHTHSPKAGLLGMIAAKLSGVPIRLHSNSGTPLISAIGIKRPLYFTTEFITSWCSTRVLPNSRSLFEYLAVSKVCSREKLVLIGNGSTNGVDCLHFNPDAIGPGQKLDFIHSVNAGPESFFFLFAGRLLASKGVIELVEAFVDLHKSYPQARLMLAGNLETHMDTLPEEVISGIYSHPAIIQLGWVKDIRLPMSVANVLVHPSHREGFPNVLLQAGAMDLPVICSDCIGNVDVIDHNQNGIVVAVGDKVKIREAMEFALSNPDVMEQYAASLHQKVVSQYNTPAVQGNVHDFYTQCLASL
jgi:glycosyltransferase involved in cell wall biosynthesis